MVAENKMVPVVKAMIVCDGKVLVLRRSIENEDVGPGSWEFVGGKMEFGETLEQALAREIREETGLCATDFKLLYATTFKTDPHREIVLLSYIGHTDSRDVRLSFEHIDYKWLAPDELERSIAPGIWADIARGDYYGTICAECAK